MTVGEAASALLRGVEDPDWARLVTGARELMGLVLAGDPPESLVTWVLADGDPALLAHLAGSDAALARDPGLADLLLTLLDPPVLWSRMLRTRRWRYRHWETLLRRSDPADPRWEAIAPEHAAYEMPSDLISVLAHSPLPAHYLASRITSRRLRLTEREQVHALARIHAAGGCDDGRYRPEVTARFRAAAAVPGGVEALLAEVDGADAAVAAMRADTMFARHHGRERPVLDWTRIASLHAESPLPAPAAGALAARGDCPVDVLIALYRTHPVAVAEQVVGSFAPLFAVSEAAHARGARRLISRLRADGRVEELVAYGRPATAVLDIARREPGFTPVHTVLRPIIVETVGDDPGTWRSLRRLLKRHPGTVRELCEDAAAAPDRDGPWPDTAPPSRHPPIGARKAFLALLEAAPASTHAALLPHLDERTRADLAAYGSTPAEGVAWADARPAAVALARVHRMHPVAGVPLVRDVLGETRLTTEALLLALRMLDGFDGTVPELLATARAVA